MLRTNFLFTDLVCPSPYSTETLDNQGLGGSEGSLVKVAEGLGKMGLRVIVHEHCLAAPMPGKNIFYISDAELVDVEQTDVVIHQRKVNPPLIEWYPKARHYLNCQDVFDDRAILEISMYIDKIKVICVSKWQRDSLMLRLPMANAMVIYNPVYDALYPLAEKNVTYDPTKLVWLSSPHKDLDYAITLLDKLIKQSGINFKLHVYNPGYLNIHKINHPNVVLHGARPAKEMLIEASDSLCLFMTMNKWKETFGIVAAEMNAIGVPVAAIRNRDALNETGGHHLSDNEEELLDKVISWSKNRRPKVSGNEKFKLSNLLKQWGNL